MLKIAALGFLLIVSPLRADFTLSDLKQLPPLPTVFDSWQPQQRLDWITKQLEQEHDPKKRYRLQRLRIGNLYHSQQTKLAKNACFESPPIKDDFILRRTCIELSHTRYEDYIDSLFEVASDAKSLGNMADAASSLSKLGWRQSQHGDIADAFTTFQQALQITPRDDTRITNMIMFNAATVYIVHGDQNYINKGVALLSDIRDSSMLELKNRSLNMDLSKYNDEELDILGYAVLASFNIGIAHTLHLHQYDKALENFDFIINYQYEYVLESLSFAAISAAELGNFEHSKYYLQQAGSQIHKAPIVDQYLKCYRLLAKRHWDNTVLLTSCLNLHEDTTVEVKFDVYKRLSNLHGSPEELEGLRKLKQLLIDKIEPELKRNASKAASHTELQRLATESNLKSQILEKERSLQLSKEAEYQLKVKYFLAIVVAFLLIGLLIITQLRQKRKLAKQFEQLSYRDVLTQLGNRRLLENSIQRELAIIDRYHREDKSSVLGIYMIDIDHFKHINDRHGHDSGDAVIVEFCRRIKQVIRESDLFIRWGGEEFIIVARHKSGNEIADLAERVKSGVNASPFSLSTGVNLEVTCTIGAVQYPFFDQDPGNELWQQLISLADLGMYWGKEKQRNCWVIINNKEIHNSSEIQDALHHPLQESINNQKLFAKASFDQ